MQNFIYFVFHHIHVFSNVYTILSRINILIKICFLIIWVCFKWTLWTNGSSVVLQIVALKFLTTESGFKREETYFILAIKGELSMRLTTIWMYLHLNVKILHFSSEHQYPKKRGFRINFSEGKFLWTYGSNVKKKYQFFMLQFVLGQSLFLLGYHVNSDKPSSRKNIRIKALILNLKKMFITNNPFNSTIILEVLAFQQY